MRVAAKIAASGKTIEEIVATARKSWQDLLGDSTAEIPEGSEIEVNPRCSSDGSHDSDMYDAVLFIRTKVDQA